MLLIAHRPQAHAYCDRVVSLPSRRACTLKHWIVRSTYNEADNILAMLSALRALPLSPGVLVVDDNSPDGTANLVRTYQEAHPEEPVALLVRPQKEGLGRAYEAGFRWVLAHTPARYIL